jgi:hypothetical protein
MMTDRDSLRILDKIADLDDKIDSVRDDLKQEINSLFRNGPISRLNERVVSVEAEAAMVHEATQKLEAAAKTRRLPDWALVLGGAALSRGYEGLQMIFSLLKGATG